MYLYSPIVFQFFSSFFVFVLYFIFILDEYLYHRKTIASVNKLFVLHWADLMCLDEMSHN